MKPVLKGPGKQAFALIILLGALLWSPGLGVAAFPQIGSTANSVWCGTNQTDDIITMPSGIVAGDLLIVIHSTDLNGGTRTWSGGFNEILDDTTTNTNIGVAYKIATGGDTLTVTRSTVDRFSAIALRIPAASWHGTTPPEISTIATGSSTTPNPNSVTASWGSADNLFIAFHGQDTTTADASVTVWPANYTQNQIQGTHCTSAGEPNLATRELAAASDDPGTFTISASRPWKAGTIVVRPAAGAATPNPGYFLYRKSITIDHAKVGNSGAPTTLADYPFLFNVTDPDLKTVSNGGRVTDVGNVIQRGSVSFSTNSGANVTLSKPTGVAQGDMMLAIVCSEWDPNTVATVPSGWTLIDNAPDGQGLVGFGYYKQAGASEGSSYTWTWTTDPGVDHGAGALIAFYATGGGTVEYDTGQASEFPASTTHTLSGITTGFNNATLVGAWCGDHGGTYSGYTSPLVEASDNNNADTDVAFAYGTQASPGASGNKSATASASDDGFGFLASVYASGGGAAGADIIFRALDGASCNPPATIGQGTATSAHIQSNGSTTNSLTWSHTTPSGNNRLLVVGVTFNNDNYETVTGVTYNGLPLTFIQSAGGSGQGSDDDNRTELWYRVAPPEGTFDVVVTFSAVLMLDHGIAAGAMPFTGVHQTTPIGTPVRDSKAAPTTNPTVTVSSAPGELVVDVVGCEDCGSLTVVSPQTQLWNDRSHNGVVNAIGASSTKAGASSVVMSWTRGTDNHWSMIAVPLKPAVGGDGESVCTLDHEIEQYDPTTGTLVAWVRIPFLNTFSASSDTVIYLYYGNSEITASTQNPTGVWATKYKGVWHLNEDVTDEGTTGTHFDSTSNDNDGTQSGNVEIAGKIARGQNFDGSNDRIQIPDVTPFELRFDGGTEDFSLMAWIKRAATGSEHSIIRKEDGSNDGYYLRVEPTDVLKAKVNSKAHTGSATIDTNWHLAVFVVNRSGNGQLYLDGAADGSPVSISNEVMATTAPVYIGSQEGSGAFFNGIIDEARIIAEALSLHQITTEYKNMTLLSCGGAFPFDATEFAICSGEENNPPSAVHLRGARAVAYEGAYAQTVQLKWRTSHEVDHLGFHVYREQNGQLLRVTPSIIAGSALLARGRTELTAGQRYSWWDILPTDGGPLQYWLEEVDLHGQRTWHGPIAVTSAKGRRDLAKPEQVRSILLSKLGRGKHKGRLPGAPWQGAADAATQTPTAVQLAVQAQLAAGPAIKLGVSAEGWYRVDQPTLIAAGLDPKVDPRRLKLYADGREVPLIVTGERDGRFDARDAIEFYGLGLETPWTDTRTYWLVAGGQASGRDRGEPDQAQWRGGIQSGPASFPYTVIWQPRELYFAALRNGETDNLFGPVVSSWPTEQAFTLNHLDPVPPGASRLEVTLQGVTDGPHAVDVQVNGTSVGTVTFNGQGQGQADLSVQASQLQAGTNLVTLVALGGEMDVSLVATVRLTYWHTYTAEEDVLRGSVPAGQQVTIGGFSTKPISVLDITHPDAVRAVPGQVKRQGSSFAVTVVGPGPGSRTLLAFTDRVAAMPAKIYANQPSRWQSKDNRADLVMISHPAFMPSLAPLKAWREQQGWTVALIDVEDLYDEFNFGAKSPFALRALVETARTQWAQAPRFLLLGGDASFDPRDTQGMGETDFVPTKLIDTDMMETASDDWFGDLDGDGVAEVAVGRLAVRTPEEAATVVQKLIGYDQTTASRTALLVADTPDSLDFEGASTRLAALLPSGMATQAIYRARSDDATTRGALLSAFNSGAWLVNYLGHGSVEVWRGEVFTSLDASTLTNGLRLPFVSTMTCLNGFFHDVWTESLAEALQRAPEGGAVGIWASSSLSEAAEQVDMNRALLKGLSAGLTFGEAVAQAKTVARHPDVRRTWILFGDPTSRLR